MLIGILPNSQKADHGISAVLAQWVPPNAGGQRTTDSLWKTLASVRRQPQIYLTNFMFHSTSFHLYGCRLNIQTGTQFCRNLSVNSTPFRALQWAATLLWLGYQKRKRREKKKRRKRCFKLKENLEKFRAHTASVTYLESFTLALDAWQTTYSSRKSSYSQFCNYLALQNTWHLYSSILYCIKTESQFSLQLTSCHQKQSVWYKAREKPAPPQIRNKSSTQGDTQIKKKKKKITIADARIKQKYFVSPPQFAIIFSFNFYTQ